jgi:hypothetical protein
MTGALASTIGQVIHSEVATATWNPNHSNIVTPSTAAVTL